MSDRIESLSRTLHSQSQDHSGFDPVSEITTILAAIPDRTEFLRALLRTARRSFLSSHEAILSFHHPTRRWFVEASHDLSDDALEDIKGLSRTVVEQARKSSTSLLIRDAQVDDRLKESRSVRAYNIQSVLTAPVTVDSELWGLIYLANTSNPSAFDEESRRQIERFASFAGMAIKRCEQFVQFSLPQLTQSKADPEIVDSSKNARMNEVFELLRQAAPTEASILLQGDTGTGKDALARWIHKRSARRDKPFVQINCAELSPQLVEVELFGVESGVATGVTFREGRIRAADGGTIFLNEVGELPLSIQAKILRVIEDRVVERVGGRNVLGVDVRFIFATNRNLAVMVEKGEFRRDLYFRINVIEAHIPSLAEHREDIPELATHIVERLCRRQSRPHVQIPKGTMIFLKQRDWPGNIRELANYLERSLMLAPGREFVDRESSSPSADKSGESEAPRVASLKAAVAEFEAAHIKRFLQSEGWVHARAARAMGIPEATLRSKLEKYGIRKPRRLP